MTPGTPAGLQEAPNGPKNPSTASGTPKQPQGPQHGPKNPSRAPGSPKWPQGPQQSPRKPQPAPLGAGRCRRKLPLPELLDRPDRLCCAGKGGRDGEGGKRRVSLKPASYRESSPQADTLRGRNTTGGREKPAGLGDPKAGGTGGSEAALGEGGVETPWGHASRRRRGMRSWEQLGAPPKNPKQPKKPRFRNAAASRLPLPPPRRPRNRSAAATPSCTWGNGVRRGDPAWSRRPLKVAPVTP